MNDLAERYVQAVLRSVPSSQRADLEREIRALVADAIEAKTAETGSATADAERAALADLGDPALLAGRYTGRTAYLIGPSVYPEWRRILSILLPIIVPVIGAVVLATNLLGGSTVGEAIVDGGTTAFNVGVQTLFWFTVVFAVIERTSGSTMLPPQPWSPDSLPELDNDGAMSASDMIGTVVANVLLLVGLLVVQLFPPIVIDGANVPLFDPGLWSFWLPWFIVVTLLEIGLAIAVYARRRWTYGYAIANALLGAAFAIPAVYLLANGLLFNPVIVDAITEAGGSWLEATTVITGVVIVGIVVFDAIDGFRKVNRGLRARGAGAG